MSPSYMAAVEKISSVSEQMIEDIAVDSKILLKQYSWHHFINGGIGKSAKKMHACQEAPEIWVPSHIKLNLTL